MTKRELKITLSVIIALALVCWAAWIIEIKVIIGWMGLKWLLRDLVSPYIICFLVAICYIFPFWIKYQSIDGKIVLTFLIFFMINLTSYLLSEVTFKSLDSPTYIYLSPGEIIGYRLLQVVTFAFFSLGYYYTTHILIMNISGFVLGLFAGCEILIFILGIITNFVIRGFGSSYGLVDSVKMGFPQFWLCILMGFIGIFVVERYSEE